MNHYNTKAGKDIIRDRSVHLDARKYNSPNSLNA